MKASKFVVTLVHGTFAEGAEWVKADGKIARALKERFGDAVLFESMGWSGANHFRARREATEKLRSHVTRSRPELDDGGARHVVVAHSHAGNVVLYAARDAEVHKRLAAVVTLATPFIVARRRNLGWSGQAASQALVLWVVLALFYLIDTQWLTAAATWQRLAIFCGLVAVVEIRGLLLATAWGKSSEAFLEQLGHASILKERLLILRAVADEATGVITFLQFPSLATTLLLGTIARLTDRYVLWCTRLVEKPLRALAFCIVTWILSLVPAFAVFVLTGSRLLMWGTLIATSCLTYFPVIFSFLRHLRLALVTAAGPIALLAAPLVLVLSVTLLVFGPRFAVANIYLDISVEATPIGAYDVTLMSPPSAGNPDTPGGLLHSALYDDDEAIELICDFHCCSRGRRLTAVASRTVATSRKNYLPVCWQVANQERHSGIASALFKKPLYLTMCIELLPERLRATDEPSVLQSLQTAR
jgi:hypothetical protein